LRIFPNDDNETRNREKWRFLKRVAAVMTAICWTCPAIHELQQLWEETATVAQCAMIMRADGTYYPSKTIALLHFIRIETRLCSSEHSSTTQGFFGGAIVVQKAAGIEQIPQALWR
jgi:pyruvate/oxaloacetate carboxyltransferase